MGFSFKKIKGELQLLTYSQNLDDSKRKPNELW